MCVNISIAPCVCNILVWRTELRATFPVLVIDHEWQQSCWGKGPCVSPFGPAAEAAALCVASRGLARHLSCAACIARLCGCAGHRCRASTAGTMGLLRCLAHCSSACKPGQALCCGPELWFYVAGSAALAWFCAHPTQAWQLLSGLGLHASRS